MANNTEIKVTVNTKQANQELNKTDKKLKDLGNSVFQASKGGESTSSAFMQMIGKVSGKAVLAVGAVAAAVGTVVKGFKFAGTKARELNSLANKASLNNMSTNDLLKLQYASNRANVPLENTLKIINKLNESTEKAKDGNTALIDSFNRLGIDYNKFDKLSNTNKLIELNDLIEQNNISFKNKDLINLVSKDNILALKQYKTKDFNNFAKIANMSGITIDKDTIELAQRYTTEIDEASSRLSIMVNQFKLITEAQEFMVKMAKKFNDYNKQFKPIEFEYRNTLIGGLNTNKLSTTQLIQILNSNSNLAGVKQLLNNKDYSITYNTSKYNEHQINGGAAAVIAPTTYISLDKIRQSGLENEFRERAINLIENTENIELAVLTETDKINNIQSQLKEYLESLTDDDIKLFAELNKIVLNEDNSPQENIKAILYKTEQLIKSGKFIFKRVNPKLSSALRFDDKIGYEIQNALGKSFYDNIDKVETEFLNAIKSQRFNINDLSKSINRQLITSKIQKIKNSIDNNLTKIDENNNLLKDPTLIRDERDILLQQNTRLKQQIDEYNNQINSLDTSDAYEHVNLFENDLINLTEKLTQTENNKNSVNDEIQKIRENIRANQSQTAKDLIDLYFAGILTKDSINEIFNSIDTTGNSAEILNSFKNRLLDLRTDYNATQQEYIKYITQNAINDATTIVNGTNIQFKELVKNLGDVKLNSANYIDEMFNFKTIGLKDKIDKNFSLAISGIGLNAGLSILGESILFAQRQKYLTESTDLIKTTGIPNTMRTTINGKPALKAKPGYGGSETTEMAKQYNGTPAYYSDFYDRALKLQKMGKDTNQAIRHFDKIKKFGYTTSSIMSIPFIYSQVRTWLNKSDITNLIEEINNLTKERLSIPKNHNKELKDNTQKIKETAQKIKNIVNPVFETSDKLGNVVASFANPLSDQEFADFLDKILNLNFDDNSIVKANNTIQKEINYISKYQQLLDEISKTKAGQNRAALEVALAKSKQNNAGNLNSILNLDEYFNNVASKYIKDDFTKLALSNLLKSNGITLDSYLTGIAQTSGLGSNLHEILADPFRAQALINESNKFIKQRYLNTSSKSMLGYFTGTGLYQDANKMYTKLNGKQLNNSSNPKYVIEAITKLINEYENNLNQFKENGNDYAADAERVKIALLTDISSKISQNYVNNELANVYRLQSMDYLNNLKIQDRGIVTNDLARRGGFASSVKITDTDPNIKKIINIMEQIKLNTGKLNNELVGL